MPSRGQVARKTEHYLPSYNDSEMSPTRDHLPLSNTSDETFVHIITDLLTPAECAAVIREHATSLTPHEITLTRRLREVFDHQELAEILWSRLEPFYGGMRIVDEDGYSWTASQLNTRFRFAKYEKGGLFSSDTSLFLPALLTGGMSLGGAFEPHVDGRRLHSIDCQTFMTVNMYLNTVLSEHGGATRILNPLVTNGTGGSYEVLGKVQPVEGSAAIFRDSLYHDGEAVGAGVKYLLRTDVVFVRDEPFDLDIACVGLSREDKGRKALELAVKLEDGGNGEQAVVWYRKAFRLWPPLEQLA